MLEGIAHSLLGKLDSEKAHGIAKTAMKYSVFAPGIYDKGRETEFLGHKLDNPLGIAAGFDKNGELVDHAWKYGFGFIEVGSITKDGGKGNPKPRLFRMEDGKLLNRMGLNGDSADVVIGRLRETKAPYGLNIAKTHNPNIIGDKAIEDIQYTYQSAKSFLQDQSNLMYVVINVSCPNTAEGKTFEDPSALRELMDSLDNVGKYKPLGIKLSPNITGKQLTSIVDVAEESVDFYEAVNTIPHEDLDYGNGGLSGGLSLNFDSMELIKSLRRLTDKPIIGVGGIREGRDADRLEKAGASLFLAYTGFVYKDGEGDNRHAGVRFAHEVNRELDSLRNTREYSNSLS
jgi:dihydroorotate dehydrogenase